MVEIIIICHSFSLAKGVSEICMKEAEGIKIHICGGDKSLEYGIDIGRIKECINNIGEDGAIILMDNGKSVEAIIEAVKGVDKDRVLLCDAPLLEGAIKASVASKGGGSIVEVRDEAEKAWKMRKI